MFSNCHSKYALKKAVDRELDKVGAIRKSTDYHAELEHHKEHENWTAVNIIEFAIQQAGKINA